MAGLDSFLDFIIPPAIFIVFGFLIYRAFQDEFRRFGRWIKRLATSKPEEEAATVSFPKEDTWYR